MPLFIIENSMILSMISSGTIREPPKSPVSSTCNRLERVGRADAMMIQQTACVFWSCQTSCRGLAVVLIEYVGSYSCLGDGRQLHGDFLCSSWWEGEYEQEIRFDASTRCSAKHISSTFPSSFSFFLTSCYSAASSKPCLCSHHEKSVYPQTHSSTSSLSNYDIRSTTTAL